MSDRVDRAAAREIIEDTLVEYGRECEHAAVSFHAARPDLTGAVDRILATLVPVAGRLDRVRVYQDEAGQYRWTRRAPNGEIVAQGEAHTRERDAYRAAARANTPDWTFDREGKG